MTRLLFLGLLAALVAGCPAAPSPRHRAAPRRASPPDRGADLLARLHQALRLNLRQYRHRLRRCHELAMAQDFRVGGRLEVVLTVAPAGTVIDVKTRHNASGSRLLARCVSHVALSFVFPASDTTTALPVRLRFGTPRAKYTVRMDDVPPIQVVGRAVTAKRLLNPKSVSGQRIALDVVRLEAGAELRLPAFGGVLGVSVLAGRLTAFGAAAPRTLGAGDAPLSLRGGGHTLRLRNTGSTRAAAVLFFPQPAWEAHVIAGGPAPAGVASGRVWIGAGLRSAGTPVRIEKQPVPAPTVVTVHPGQRAVINPAGDTAHHALLVTSGALWVTLRGVRLPAEAGMAIYVPGGAKALATPAIRRDATFVIMPWTGAGSWSAGVRHELVRFEKAPLPEPLPRPRRAPGFRIPGQP